MASSFESHGSSYIDYNGILPTGNEKEKTKTIVLDMENTLVYSTPTHVPHSYDYTVTVRGHQEHSAPSTITYYVQKRPSLDFLLLELARNNYEVIVFTSADKEYADAILDKLDASKALIDIRMYRDSCLLEEGGYVKDLTMLSRDLKNVIIVDDNPYSYKLQPQNAFPVKPFSGDLNDREIWGVRDLCKIAASSGDVRETIRIYMALSDSNNLEYERFRERRRELQLIQEPVSMRKKIIVLEMMGVLIKTSMEAMKGGHDFTVPVSVSGNLRRTIYVQKRPGLDNLLSELEQNYRIVLFTRATQEEADPILDKLDINFHLNRRLYRNSCRGGYCCKDLDALKIDLNLYVNPKNVIVVDCDPVAFNFQFDNGVRITPFTEGNMNDTELYKLKGFCKGAALYDDVREAVTRWTNNEIHVYGNIRRRSLFSH